MIKDNKIVETIKMVNKIIHIINRLKQQNKHNVKIFEKFEKRISDIEIENVKLKMEISEIQRQ
jgi:hypothetical protein